MNQTATGRLQYFDVLKGIAIFMVVMGHVITMCIRGVDRTPLFKFIGEIHMPLFFFISGWFTFRLDGSNKLKRPRLGMRAKQLLVPMAVVSTLWLFYFPYSGLQSPLPHSFFGLWLSVSKNGYWFTLCLFEIILLYACVRPLLNVSKSGCCNVAVALGVFVLLILAYYLLQYTYVGGFLSLEYVMTYWPAFMAGLICARFKERFDKAVTNAAVNTGAIILGGATLYYICWWWEFDGLYTAGENVIPLAIARSIFHICLAVVAVAVFKPAVNNTLTADGRAPRWVRLWSCLGKASLGIYLLHYFFLFPLGSLKSVMLSMNLGFVPMFIVAALAAAVIIAVVLGVMKVLSVSAPLNYLLTGTLPKPTSK